MGKNITCVEFHGFTMKELNTRYTIRPVEVIQGRPSYWDVSGVFFVYWQDAMARWAICDMKCLEAVRQGQCPGWAYRSDSSHFANACGWMERRADVWTVAIIETAVHGTSTKGLKVEFSGFTKPELNTTYIERPDLEIQGKMTYWNPQQTYFIYWQGSLNQRWAICDQVSLASAKAGLSPGWAYRVDSAHFAKSGGWMEAWGGDFSPASCTCQVLEGIVRDDLPVVKAETETVRFSTEQCLSVVRDIYEVKNPAKLADVDGLVAKFKGREHELVTKICDKYQVNMDELAADHPFLVGGSGDGVETTKEEEDDEWDDAEVPELAALTAAECAVLIQNVYEKHNAKKLQDLARLLQKYRHRERELYHEVCKKYKVHPAKFYAKHLKEEEK